SDRFEPNQFVEFAPGRRMLAVALEEAFAFPATEQVEQTSRNVWQHHRRDDLIVECCRPDADVRLVVGRLSGPRHCKCKRVSRGACSALLPDYGNANRRGDRCMRLQRVFGLIVAFSALTLFTAAPALAAAYKNFRAAIYVTVHDTKRLAD